MKDKFKNLNTKEPVRLRTKKLTNGGYSLYLDTYWNGQRTYEFLKLYLNKETDEIAVMENKTTIEIARQIKYKRILSLRLASYGPSNLLPRPSFRDYFTDLANQRDEFRSNADNWA